MQVDGGIVYMSLTTVGTITGNVTFAQVSNIGGDVLVSALATQNRGLFVTPRTGSTLSLFGAFRLFASGATATLSAVRLGPLSECRDVLVEMYLGARPSTLELLSRDSDAIFMRGGVTVIASGAVGAVSTMTNISIGAVQKVSGNVNVVLGAHSTLTYFGIAGPTNSLFDVEGDVTVAASAATATLREVALTGLQAVTGSVSITNAGTLQKTSLLSSAIAGVQITGNLNISGTARLSDVTLSPLTLVRGRVDLGLNLDKINLNSASTGTLPLTIEGAVTVGTGALDAVSGEVTFNNVLSMGALTVYTASTQGGNGEVRVYGNVNEKFVIQGDLVVSLVRQTAVRRITLTNLLHVGGVTSMFLSSTANVPTAGPISLNSKTVNRIGTRLYDNATKYLNDPSCINICSGRGYETTSSTVLCDRINATNELNTVGCDCWPGNGGSYCADFCPPEDLTCPCQ
jgi:hypothetical protein